MARQFGLESGELRARARRVLLSLLVIGAMTSVAWAGTFATFTAQAANPTNKFALGTLVLSNKVGAGSACLSTGGGTTDTNTNDTCDTAFNLSLKKPGDAATVNLTLKNQGSRGAAVFRVYAASCTNGDASGQSYHDTGNPCGKIQLYLQETQADFTTPVACAFGGAVGTTCNFADPTKTLDAFATTYNTSGNGLSLGTIAAGVSRYFVLGMQMPANADNTYQGRAATIPFAWYIAQ